MERRTRAHNFVAWKQVFDQKELVAWFRDRRDRKIKETVLLSLDAFRLKKIEKKYHMLRIIQFMGERPSNLIVSCTKAFLG